MAGNFWNQFGSDYQTINQNLGGIPDFIKGVGQKINDLPVNQFMAKHPVLGSIYSGAQSAANMVTGGLQGGINQKLDPTGTQGLEQVQAQHPIGTGIGQGLGLAGGMALTPTAAPAEAGTVAARILPTLGRNALTAGAMASPGTVAEGVQTGDWNQALGHGLENTALGTLLGTGAEKGAQLLSPLLNKIQAKAMGLSTRDIKQVINQQAKKFGVNVTGSQAAKGEGVISDVVDLGNKFGAWFQKGKQALWNHVKEGYGQIADLADKAGSSIGDALPQIAQREDLNKARQIFGNASVDNELLNQASQIDKMNWTDARIHTGDTMAAAFREKLPDDPIKLKGAVAEALHNHLGETAQNLVDAAHAAGNTAVPNLHDMDAIYGAAKAIHGAEAKEAISLPATFSPGSDTAARVGVNQVLMGGLGGVGGLGVAAATGGVDPNDPSTYLPTLLKVAGGSVAGRMLNRGAAKLGEVGAGLTARGLKAGLEAAQPLSPQILQLGTRLPQLIQQANAKQQQEETPGTPEPAQTPEQMPTQTPDTSGISQADVEALGGQLTPDQQKVRTLQPNAEIPAPEHAKDVAAAIQKEQTMAPAQVQAAKDSLAPAQERIKQKLMQVYQSWENPYKDDWDKFYKDALTYSDNFNPTNKFTAKIIGGPDYKDYLKAYNVSLRLKTLGPDLARAISWTPVSSIGQDYLQRRRERDELVNTIYTAATGDMKSPGKADRQSIENKLNILRKQTSKQGARQRLLDMMQRDYGLRTDLLEQYGLNS